MEGLDQLRIRLLGGLDVDGVDPREVGSRKARTLVKVLALARGSPVPADRVVEALWPGDDTPLKPVDQVGVLVSRLRSVVGADRLTRTDAGWALAVDWLDVVELEERVDEAAARLAAGNPGAARAAARAALTLVRGDLLADEPDPVWAEADRAAVGRAVARGRLIAAEAALAAGDPVAAATEAEGALDHDAYDEAALRLLMRADTAAGRPASALAAYARVRERLAEDLGVDPLPETEALHTAILLGDPPVEAPAPVAAPALVGRAAELAELDDLLGRVERGAALLAVVEGEAGIGKTSLVSAWSANRRADALVLTGRCDELGRDLPLQPVLDGLEQHLRSLDADQVEAVLADAEPVLGPLLGRFSVGPSGPVPTTVRDAGVGQALLFASLLAAIERAADDRPAVVIAEDVHLASASTTEWLRFAARRGHRLLVLATRRPEGGPVGPAVLVPIGPLDLGSVAELVGEDRAPDLYARSGGHPLFLLELAHAAPGELPASVREAVAARVDGLGEAATTLRAAAILGSEVDVDLLAAVLDRSVATLLEHLDAGLQALLVEERSATFAFRHGLVRDALAADTSAARRAFVHREAARVLERRPGHDPMEVAWHARHGGDVPTAVTALIDAAATASSRYDTALAEELLTDAIGLEDIVAARVARALVRIARFDLDGANADALRAVELGGGPSALEVAGWASYYQRNYDLARQRADEAGERTDDPGVRASCLTLSGRILHASGRLPEADARLTEAVDRAPASVRGVAQVFLGGLRIHQGAVAEGADLVDRALLDPARIGHPFAVHHAHLFRVLALGMQGRPIDALAAVEVGQAAATEAGEAGTRFRAVQDNLRSWVLRSLGHLDEADDWTGRALEVSAASRTSMSEMYYAAELDRIEGRLLAGDIDGASDELDGIDDIAPWNGGHAWHHRQRFHLQRARVALARSDLVGAAEDSLVAITDSVERRTLRYRLFATVTAAQAGLAAGEAIEHDDLDRALDRLEACGGLEVWRVTAELAAASGVDRWWRDAERRAGALIAESGDHGETLRRSVATTFTALGR